MKPFKKVSLTEEVPTAASGNAAPAPGDHSLQWLVRPEIEIRWKEDVSNIRRALNALGYDAEDLAIQQAYEDFSETEYCAGWLDIGTWDNTQSIATKLITGDYLMPKGKL